MNSNGSNSSGDSNSMDDFNLSDDSDQSSRPSSSLSLHYLEDFHDANEKFDHEDVSNAEHSLDVDSMTREEFISYQRKLTYMERDAESERETMKTINLNGEGMQGVVPHLKLESTFTSRFGKVCVVFSSYAHKKLPSHGLRKGDNVGIYNGGVLCRDEYFCLDGIVLEVSSVEITVSLNEAYEFPPEGGYSIKHYPSLENVRRILQGLSDMLEARGPANHLAQVLFKEVQPLSPMPRLPPQICKRGTDELEFFNDNLDESQKSAVQFVLQQQDLAVVHGPPGTGKTTTLVEIIRQHVKMGVKVLAMAPSNQGVDNLVERLDDVGLKVVRIGHPARTTDATQRHTIDVLLHTSDGSEIILDIRREMRSLSQKLNSTPARERRAMHVELGKLRRELNERQERLSRSLVRNADVVLCTLLSASSHGQLRHLFWDHFGLTVIDECSQGTEASCYLGVLRSPKLVLAGDHKQLPPTVLCPEASYLLTSLMERIISTYGNTVVRMLTIQYRMHIDIMTWASNAMYDGNLVAHSSVEKQLLCQLPGVEHNLLTACPITLVDTSSSPGFEENDLPASAGQASSKSNDGEAELVLGQVSRLLKAGLRQDQVAVITPYSKQVKLVRSLVCGDFPGVEVQTVDGFQGREKEAVILTLVRSNNKGEIGFLAETRRLNVAVTRAKRHLSVVCDVATLRHNTFLSGFVDYMMDRANIVQAEHLDEGFCWIMSYQCLKTNQLLQSINPDLCVPDNVRSLRDFTFTSQEDLYYESDTDDEAEAPFTHNDLVRQYHVLFLYSLNPARYARRMRGFVNSVWDFKDINDLTVVSSLLEHYSLDVKSCPLNSREEREARRAVERLRRYREAQQQEEPLREQDYRQRIERDVERWSHGTSNGWSLSCKRSLSDDVGRCSGKRFRANSNNCKNTSENIIYVSCNSNSTNFNYDSNTEFTTDATNTATANCATTLSNSGTFTTSSNTTSATLVLLAKEESAVSSFGSISPGGNNLARGRHRIPYHRYTDSIVLCIRRCKQLQDANANTLDGLNETYIC